MDLCYPSLRRCRAAIALLCLLLGSSIQAQVNNLVISQVYGAGGNTGATYNRDFIEIFNPTAAPVLLTGKSVQYASSAGSTWSVTALSGTLAPGQYYLVGLASGANGLALPTPDALGTTNMSGTAGKVALMDQSVAVTAGLTCPTTNLIDMVSFGPAATACEGSPTTPNLTAVTAALRASAGCTDTNSNVSDFSNGTPTPRNTAASLNYCGPTKLAIVTIADQTAGIPFSVVVSALDPNDVARNVFVATQVTLSSNGNAGAIGGTVTGSIPAGQSTFTFTNISFPSSGIGVQITATRNTGDVLTAGLSNTFNVQAGSPVDCEGTPGGGALPGTACVHADPCVIGELWDAGCNCVGPVVDSDNDGTCDTNDGCPFDINKIAPGACGCGSLEVNASCNDNNACTSGDVITVCGTCAGTPLLDSDNDGTCDDVDECDSDPLKILAGACGCGVPEVGASCDDLDGNTVNDTYVACGVCAGVTPFVYWDFTTAIPTTELLPNATAGAVSQGNNNGTTTLLINGSVSSGYAGASGTFNANAAARTGALNTGASGSAYFEFTVLADPDYVATITGVSFGTRSTSTGPQAYTLRSSLDAFTADIATGAIANNSVWALKSNTGLAVNGLSGAPITFRLYGHGGTGSPSANTSNWRIDDMNVQGTTTFSPVVPVVGFTAATSSTNESVGSFAIDVSMDLMPSSPVTVDVTDAGTGTGVNGTDYIFTNTTLTFPNSGTYPLVQSVLVSPVGESVYDPDFTVKLELALTGGTAATSLVAHTLTVLNDDLPSLVINEVNYDETSTDVNEYVEIRNNGATTVDLGGLRLQVVDGVGPAYTVLVNTLLSTTSVAAGDYYVVCYGVNANAYCDQSAGGSTAIQNGPDGIRLTTAGGTIIDQMSYEGATSTTEGTTAGTDPGNDTVLSLCRIPNGSDTNDNSIDFVATCMTPGTSNGGADSDNDGTPDCLDVCPGGPEPGSVCDDLNENTGNDVVLGDCSCAGEQIDCLGEVGGPALPGETCIDGNPFTLNDVYQPNCVCAGELPDCLSQIGGPAVPGTPCNDNDPSTNDETFQEVPYCDCVGTPCSQNVTIELRTDLQSEQAGWEILYQNDATVVCSGGHPGTLYPEDITAPITADCCLPIGCFRLRVFDSAGDGFTSGGYQLRESGETGRRIIDNLGNFSTGSTSAIAETLDNGAFCVPISNVKPIFASCDKLDWVNYQFIVASEDAAVSAQYDVTPPIVQPTNSGYEFWFFDPNGSYSYRRFRSHSTSDGFGSGTTRACHLKVNKNVPLPPGNQATNQEIPYNKLLNVRIRARVAGTNMAFGPACMFKIDPTAASCPVVKLQDNPLNTADFSCGVTRTFGGANSSANKIVANPPQFAPAVVSSNVRYQFRFRVQGEINAELTNPWACIVRPPQTSPTLYLNWTTGQKLKCNTTYEVDVRVSKDGGATWCVGGATTNPADCGVTVSPWGKVCNVTIGTSTFCPVELAGGSNNLAVQGNGALTMYPNPNRGDQVFISLSEVATGVNTVSVDIYDLSGKKVTTRAIAVQDGNVNTFLKLNGDLAGGMYMVNITAGDKTYTERLVIQP